MCEPPQARPSTNAGGPRSIVAASLLLVAGAGEVALAAFADGAMLRVLWALFALTLLASGLTLVATLRSRSQET